MTPPIFGNGGLLGSSGRLASELGKPEQDVAEGEDSYRLPLDVEDFDSFGAQLQQGEEVELASLVSPAGIERRWGFGRADNPENQGYAYAALANANGEAIHGRVIFGWRNSTGRETEVSEEVSSKDMDTNSRYNRDAQPPVPEAQDKNKAEQDEELTVGFVATTDPANITNSYIVDATSSEVRWPTTEFDVSS